MKRWLLPLLPIAAAVVTALHPVVQAAVANHPVAAIATAAIYAVFAHIFPSPLDRAPGN